MRPVCRLLAVVSATPRGVADVVGQKVLDAWAAMSRFHRDGWGAAWVDAAGGSASLRYQRSVLPAHADPDFTARALAPSRAILMHLRWASTGMDVTGLNTHPFVSGGTALAHNGYIAPINVLDSELPVDVVDACRGTTDSERYAQLVHHHQEAGLALPEAVQRAAAELRRLHPCASLNAVVLGTGSLVVVHANEAAVPDVAAMHAGGMTVDNALAEHLDGRYYRMSVKRLDDGTLAFSSSGIPREGWVTLPDETVTAVDLASGEVRQRGLLEG